ncbi:hypothetical protein NKH77_50500 [Streptomyces sp. M19]
MGARAAALSGGSGSAVATGLGDVLQDRVELLLELVQGLLDLVEVGLGAVPGGTEFGGVLAVPVALVAQDVPGGGELADGLLEAAVDDAEEFAARGVRGVVDFTVPAISLLLCCDGCFTVIERANGSPALGGTDAYCGSHSRRESSRKRRPSGDWAHFPIGFPASYGSPGCALSHPAICADRFPGTG